MKKMEAIIKPYLLEDLRDVLQNRGLEGMTISEIQHHTRLKVALRGLVLVGEGEFPEADFEPRLKVEIAVQDEEMELAAALIQRVAGIQSPVWVQDLEDVVRIRTCEHGRVAI